MQHAAFIARKQLFLYKLNVMNAAIDEEIQKYLPLLGNEEKKSLLGIIKSFINLKKDNYEIDAEQDNKEIEEALIQYKTGNYKTQDDTEKESKEW